MYNKKLLKNIVDGLDKAKKPKAAKDIIYDPKGQWKHPGEVTRIPSSSITMKGVGYPVLGVPNKGAPSMMQPNQDYNFPEADYVDEYPHMDGGGQIYTYAARPGSYYKKDVNGKWLIKNEGTKGKYVVVDDPKGTRTKALNAQAKPMPAKKPTVQQPKYDPLYDTSSVQKAGTTQVSNLMKRDTPEFITNPIKYKKDQEAAAKAAAKNKINIQQKKYNDALMYTRDYMQSPKYKEMLKKSTRNTGDYSDISKDRLKNLASIPNVEILKNQPADRPRTAAYSKTANGKITMLPKGYNSKGTFAHELSHSVDRPTGFLNNLLDVRNNIPESDRNYINKHKAKSLMDSRDYRAYNIMKSYNPNMNYETANKDFKDFYTDYVGEDTETRARLNAIRKGAKENGLYDPFTQGVSPDLYHNKLKKFKFETGSQRTLDPMNQLQSTYSDEEIIWMLNNISKNENQEEDVNESMARKGGSLKSKKYTKNLDGTNYLFAESSLFKKPKKLSKKRIFHPHAKYYKTGGESGCPEGYAFNPVTGECVEWDPEVWDSEEQPTSYDPIGDIIYMNPNDRPEGMSDEEYQQMYQDQIEHEQLHRLQWINGGLKGNSGTPLRMPSTVDNQEYDGEHYYNRRGEEESYLHSMFNQDNPELAKFIPSDVIYDKVINPSMYDIPWTEEGEARGYEGALHNGMESLFPKRKTGGALLTKKVTCKKCGWKWDAADGGDDITTCHKCGGQGLIHAQGGGVTKTKLSDKEEKTFQKFYNTLPDNLQSDDDTYDIRGYWDSEGRPEEFNYDQPKDKDGYYHASSINGNTGEYLKSPAHETFQHAVDEDRKMGYRPVTNVYGRNIVTENESIIPQEQQSFLRNTEGPANYIEADLTPEEIQEYAKGGYIVEDISIPSLNQKQVGGPQGPPLLVNNALLTSNQKIAAAAHASPTRENAAKLQSLKDQKVKEEADKAARIAAYKKKQAEEKAKAEGIARWYEEEKKRRAEEEVLFGNNGVQASDATRVDTGYLSPLIGIAKDEEENKRNQEDKIYNSQQNAIKKGYKTIYDYENDPMGAKWDQAQANEAAWLQSGAERPMVNTGEMGYNKGFTNDKSGWDPITKKYYTKTGIYDPKTKKWKPNPSYFKGSGAIQSVDEVWAAPIAIPAALEGIGALAALEIPGLGATVGQAVNAGFVAHGVSKLPETGGAWYDAYKSGTGDYRDAIEKTFWNALDFAGAGELKSPLKLQAATAERSLAETPLQKFIGKTGVTAEEIANTHVDDFDSMAFTDDFDNLLTERYMQDDLAEAFRRIENRSNQLPKPPNELYIDPVHLEPALAGDGSKAALTAERDWLMDEYKSLGLENYDNYINDAPQAISQRASELEVEIATLNNRLRTQVQNATTSSPAAADIMNFRNQPGYISSTEQAAVDNAFTTRVQLPVDDIEEFAHNPFAGLRGERDIEITPLRRDTALRINSNVVPGTGGRTVAETLAMHDNPLNAMIDVRRFAQEGIIGENSAADLMTSLRQEIKKMPIKGDEKKFFIKEAKRISNVPKDVPYTGSALTDRELDKLMTAIPLEERTAIFDKYGYTVDDLIQFDGKYGANDQLMNVAQNQVYDDIRYLRDHGIPNPNPPVINFKTGEISELLQQESELANIGLSEETLKTINETRYPGTLNEQRVKPKTSGVVEYNYVEEQQIHKLKDTSIIPETKDLDKLIKSYEEAVSKLKDGDIKDALTTQLEDYKSTKWLRTEYADELKAQGLTPSEIEKASIISNHGGRKNIIDGKGNVVGTLNAYAAKTYEGTKGFKIGSTGVNYKFHPYNLKHSKFKSWDKAQEYFEKQVLEKNLATITNEADRTNPIMIKHFKRQAKVKAEELVKQLQDNNNNRWGEALYRGVHHGVKDTKGPVFTDQHFVSTSLPDAFTGTKIERYRAENYWNSQMKQLNELGVPKAAAVKMPSTHPAYSQYDINDLNNLPPTNLVIKRKQGGDIDKLNKFIY